VTIADRLRRLLDERGLSIREAAELADMHHQQIGAIVSGDNPNPSVKTVERIVRAAGGTLGEFFADGD
jgi:transcriptional regulator with XRE-family HTH domain